MRRANEALERLLAGDLTAVVVDIKDPPASLSDVPVEQFRMLPIYNR